VKAATITRQIPNTSVRRVCLVAGLPRIGLTLIDGGLFATTDNGFQSFCPERSFMEL
jgi:hypothetical protein